MPRSQEKLSYSAETTGIDAAKAGGFIDRVRRFAQTEKKLVFTFPRPGEGLVFDLAARGAALGMIPAMAEVWSDRSANMVSRPGEVAAIGALAVAGVGLEMLRQRHRVNNERELEEIRTADN